MKFTSDYLPFRRRCKGLPDEEEATVYFNESTGLVFVQLPDDDEEEYQVGPRKFNLTSTVRCGIFTLTK